MKPRMKLSVGVLSAYFAYFAAPADASITDLQYIGMPVVEEAFDGSGDVGGSGSVAPAIDILGYGWHVESAAAAPKLVGGKLTADGINQVASIELPRQGPRGSIVAKFDYVSGSTVAGDWVGFGFTDAVKKLTTVRGGAWVKVFADGDVELIGGPGNANSLGTASLSLPIGTAVELGLFYDLGDPADPADHGTLSLYADGVAVAGLQELALPAAPPSPVYYSVQFKDTNCTLDNAEVHRAPRRRPLTGFPTSPGDPGYKMINVWNPQYAGGAVIDDGIDDAPAIQAAIDAARAWANDGVRVAEIRFRPGTYNLGWDGFDPVNPELHGGSLLFLDGGLNSPNPVLDPGAGICKNIFFNGRGAHLELNNITKDVIRVQYSDNVIFDDFTIDCYPYPFVEGTIVAMEAGSAPKWIELDIDTDDSALGDPSRTTRPLPNDPIYDFYATQTVNQNFFNADYEETSSTDPCDWRKVKNWGHALDSAGRIKPGTRPHYFHSKILSVNDPMRPNVFRLDIQGKDYLGNDASYAELNVGDRFMAHSRWNACFRVLHCDDVTIMDTTMYSMSGQFMAGNFCDGWNILDCTVTPKAGFTKSINADFCVGEARTGVWMEGNFVKGISDDVLNQVSKSNVVISDNPGVLTDPNKQLEIRKYLGLLGGGPCATADDYKGNGYHLFNVNDFYFRSGDRVRLFNGSTGEVIDELTVDSYYNGILDINGTEEDILTFVETFNLSQIDKSNDTEGTIVVNESLNSGFVIHGNTFENIRGHVRIGTNGYVYDNTLKGFSRNAIRLFGEFTKREAFNPGTGGVIIDNCILDKYAYTFEGFSVPIPSPEPGIDVYFIHDDPDNPSNRDGVDAKDVQIFSDIYITNNFWRPDWIDIAIAVRNVENSLISGTRFSRPELLGGGVYDASAFLEIEESEEVRIWLNEFVSTPGFSDDADVIPGYIHNPTSTNTDEHVDSLGNEYGDGTPFNLVR